MAWRSLFRYWRELLEKSRNSEWLHPLRKYWNWPKLTLLSALFPCLWWWEHISIGFGGKNLMFYSYFTVVTKGKNVPASHVFARFFAVTPKLLLRSWVSLSVRDWWHPTKFSFMMNYIQVPATTALYWSSTINYQLLSPHTDSLPPCTMHNGPAVN